MFLKDTIKAKICAIGQSPDFSLRPFIRWAAMLDKILLLKLLDEIQIELDEEEHLYRELAKLVGSSTSPHHQLRQDWCVYCGQLRAYYRERYNKGRDQSKELL